MKNEQENSYEKLRVGGLTFHTRPNSWDKNVVNSVVSGQEYALPPLPIGAKVLDIGAHIGSFSVLMASKGYSVTSVEPSPDNFNLLLLNMKENGFKAQLHWGGVCDRSCEVAVQHVPENMGSSKTVKGTGVSCETLASYLPQGVLDLLKIDCEGCEYAALKDIVENHSRIRAIVGEVHGSNAPEFLRKLKPYYDIKLAPSKAASAILFLAVHL